MQWLLILTAASIVIGALAQSVTGLGFSLVAAPSLLALLGTRDGVAVVVVLAAVVSLIALVPQWRHTRVRDAGVLLVPTLLATPVVVLALGGVDASLVAAAAGLSVIAGVVLLARGASWAWFRGLPGAVVAGVASAVLNVVGGVGGPPMGMYAANAGWGAAESNATLQFFFLVQNVVTAVVIGLVRPAAWMLVALLVGTLAGVLVSGRIPERTARIAVLVVAALGGASLVAGSI
ncbi:MAG TPA: TSUP family transporter [Actinomycetota bacterium]|nr:TSUP family transporter [Actinomycetota bacterium]